MQMQKRRKKRYKKQQQNVQKLRCSRGGEWDDRVGRSPHLVPQMYPGSRDGERQKFKFTKPLPL